MPAKPFRKRRLEKTAQIKSLRAMRPVHERIAMHYKERFPGKNYSSFFTTHEGKLFGLRIVKTHEFPPSVSPLNWIVFVEEINPKTKSITPFGEAVLSVSMNGIQIHDMGKSTFFRNMASKKKARYRGTNLVRAIVEAAIQKAKELGKELIWLETNSPTLAAHYARFGFQVMNPRYFGRFYMELHLK